MNRFRVVICGGGIAAVEGLLRLRSLAGDSLEITFVAPAEELRYRPLAVDEPFAMRGVRRYALRTVAQRTGAEWVQDAADWVDPDGQAVHTSDGQELPYDALLLAVGARLVNPFEHVTLFDDAHADEAFHGLVQDVEEGYTRSVALLLPEGPAWLLPGLRARPDDGRAGREHGGGGPFDQRRDPGARTAGGASARARAAPSPSCSSASGCASTRTPPPACRPAGACS